MSEEGVVEADAAAEDDLSCGADEGLEEEVGLWEPGASTVSVGVEEDVASVVAAVVADVDASDAGQGADEADDAVSADGRAGEVGEVDEAVADGDLDIDFVVVDIEEALYVALEVGIFDHFA